MQLHRIAFDLGEGVLEVVGVKTDLDPCRAVIGGDFLGGGAVIEI